jgi:hypothetical protein
MTFVPKSIGVYPPSGFDRLKSIFDALSDIEAVTFSPTTEPRSERWDGLLLVDAPHARVEELSGGCERVFILCTVDIDREAKERQIGFSASVSLRSMLRRRTLPSLCTLASGDAGFDRTGSAEVLATADGDPVWLRVHSQGRRIDVSRAALTVDSPGALPFQQLRSGQFAALLPLVHFVQDVAGGAAAERTSVRACFMFDDPNLHWPSFGHVDFREILRHAAKQGFHTSFATVPLDAWYSHAPTVRLFKDNPQLLSLLIHGNNHVKRELALAHGKAAREALVAQSLRRIGKLEAATGLSVARVMAAPHAACTDAMGGAMLRFGYQAACISRAALMAANTEMVWPNAIGLRPAEFIGGGLPVIPRFGLSMSSQASMVIAAFLGQPVILVGHHNDLALGYDLLTELSDFIGSLGKVHWMDLAAISDSNYRLWVDGTQARIDMYSRKVELSVSSQIKTLVVRRPWILDSDDSEILSVRGEAGSLATLTAGSLSMTSPIHADGRTVVASALSNPGDPMQVAPPNFQVWPLARRVLAEARDRLQPFSRALLSPHR